MAKMSSPSELKGGKIRIGISGSDAGKDSPRIERAVRRFLSSLAAAGRSRATTASYSRELGRLVDLIGDVPLKEVSPGNLQAVVDRLAGPGSGGNVRHPSTVNRIKSVYRSFFSWCCDSGFISMNPSSKLKMAKAMPLKTFPITKAEIGMFISMIRGSGHPLAMRDEALFAVYAYTGIRRPRSRRKNVPMRVRRQERHGCAGTVSQSDGANETVDGTPCSYYPVL